MLNRCEAINFLTNKWRKWGACFGNHVVKNLTPLVPLGNAKHVFNLRKSTNSNEPAIRKRTLDYSIITNIKKIAFREKDLLESDILHSRHTSLTAFSARSILQKSELNMWSEVKMRTLPIGSFPFKVWEYVEDNASLTPLYFVDSEICQMASWSAAKKARSLEVSSTPNWRCYARQEAPRTSRL